MSAPGYDDCVLAMTGDIPDLDAIRKQLEAQRDELRERIAVLAKRPERGSGLGFGKRIGDGTTEAVSRLTDIGVGRTLEQTLAKTDRALAKLHEGNYGTCDDCGDTIPAGRLRALPESALCVSCASKARRLPPRRSR